MIVGLNNIGDSLMKSSFPTSSTNIFYYVELKNGLFDELYIAKDNNIADTSKSNWTLSTYLKATFLNNLEAGNVELGGLIINKWKIRRRKLDSINFKQLNIVDMGTDENFYYIDTSPRSDIMYEYEIIPMSGDIEGSAHTVQIKISFDYWWISDIDTEETYPFFANLEVGDINNNIKRFVYEGFDEFPTISYGKQKYQSGTITALLLDNFLETNKNYRDKVEAFLNNRKRKYLKNPNGDIWVIDTYTTKRTPYTQVIEDISSISFEWQEVAKYEE